MIGDVPPVLADFSQIGSSDQYGRIMIDTRDMAIEASARRASVVLLVYDSTTRIDLESGSYAITLQVPKEDTTWGAQTAVVLAVEGQAMRDIQLRLAVMPEEPVKWRAIGATFDGKFRSYPKVQWFDEAIFTPPTALDEIVAAFFAGQPVVEVGPPIFPGDLIPPKLPTSPVTDTTGFEQIDQCLILWAAREEDARNGDFDARK